MFNANNYGYNPYGTYIPPRPMQQPMQQPQQDAFNTVQQRSVLNGKQVDSIDVVKAIEYPLDGSVSYFPLTDNSAIVTKQICLDGKSKMTVYKPILDEEEQNKYITPEELKKAIDNIDLSEIDDIKEELKDIKKKLKKNGVKDE